MQTDPKIPQHLQGTKIGNFDYSFTQMQCLNAIAYWPYQKFNRAELDYLLKQFTSETDADNASYTYGQNDIYSYILEVLSEKDN